jgi:peptidoglycan/LPS O-acetylase OafA/YrhL
MPELDSVRGIAILMVLFFHGMAPPLHVELPYPGRLLFSVSQYGWTGVNLFFVLSGFLITGILIDSRNRPDYFRRFYFRRALRILPALYGLLIVLVTIGWISFRFFAVSAFFFANFAPALGIGLQYGPLWSLAVEEHFYMFWPLVVRLGSNRKLLVIAASVCIGCPLLRMLNFSHHPDPQSLAFLYTWFNLDGLSLGALLAIWLRMPSFRRPQLVQVAGPALVVGIVAFRFLLNYPLANAALINSACNLAAAGFLGCMLLLGSGGWGFVVDRPILKFFGFISYGLYLVHILAFHLCDVWFATSLSGLIASGRPMAAVLLRFIGGVVLATGIAYVSRRSLEERFLRIGYSSKSVTLA